MANETPDFDVTIRLGELMLADVASQLIEDIRNSDDDIPTLVNRMVEGVGVPFAVVIMATMDRTVFQRCAIMATTGSLCETCQAISIVLMEGATALIEARDEAREQENIATELTPGMIDELSAYLAKLAEEGHKDER